MLEKVQITMPEAADYFYSASSEKQDTERKYIGHLRGDFGSSGERLWSTWFEHQPMLKLSTFRTELQDVVIALAEQGLLKSRYDMHDYCLLHPDARLPGSVDVYGFCFQTANHRYYLRCFPHAGDYNVYLYCYARPDRLAERSPNLPDQAHSRPVTMPRKKSEPER